MSESSFLHGWVVLIGSVAVVAIILASLELMVGIVKPAAAVKHVGATLGIVILLTLIPGIVLGAWSGKSLWQRVVFVAIGVGVWRLKQWGKFARRTKRR